MKNHKAAGPDGVRMELYKHLPDQALLQILATFNDWWIREDIPEDLTDAQVVLIYKKGDTNLFENYRPISLLN
eukprot:1216002-Prorocentrum_lima.AAC.1